MMQKWGIHNTEQINRSRFVFVSNLEYWLESSFRRAGISGVIQQGLYQEVLYLIDYSSISFLSSALSADVTGGC